jgi:TetR/AcrR family acrAB operon transcriptional repressor
MAPDARRQHILEAATSCFTSAGYHETTIDHIAERAGLSKGAVYWHFDSKRDLFLALLDAMLTLSPEVLEPEGAVPPRAAIQRMADAAIAAAASSAGMAGLMVEYLAHAARDEEVRGLLRDKGWLMVLAVAAQIERGMQMGVFRSVDAQAAAVAFLSPIDGLMLHQLVRPELDVERAWTTSVELFLDGLTVRRAS